MYGFTHVKDPVVLVVGGEYLAFTSVAWRDQHLGQDRHNVVHSRGRGMIALHRSPDGIDFPTAQIVAEPGPEGWGGINVRPSAFVYLAPTWTMLFDAGVHPRRELRRADDAGRLHRPCHLEALDARPRALGQLFASRWVRTDVDAVLHGDTVHYFYEYAREDRAHDLRHIAIPLACGERGRMPVRNPPGRSARKG